MASTTTSAGGNVSATITNNASNVSRSGNTVYATVTATWKQTSSWTSNSVKCWIPAGGTAYTLFNSNSGANHTSSSKTYSASRDCSWGVSASQTSLTYEVGYGWNGWSPTQKTKLANTITFSAGSYTVNVDHWTWGYKNGEGNNGAKNAFKLADTSFSVSAGSNYTMDSSRAVSSPNGFSLSGTFGGSSVAGSWTDYPMPTTFSAGNHTWQYDYEPISYSITYNMNGGTNNSSNPSSYNVLYGVTFANPTREHHTFKNWTIGGTAVTGINPGANASFSSPDDLRNKCASRTTGNKTVVANWIPDTYQITYNANGGSGAPAAQTKTYGVNLTLSSTRPTRSGYVFKGWATSSTGAVVYQPGGTYTANAAATLYAVWEIDQAVVYYKNSSGTWVKGKVWYKNSSGTWVKAKKFYTKVNGTWKENKTTL